MNSPERQEKYEMQTEQIYASIGRFAVKFEHVCHAMHAAVMNLLQMHGLRDQMLCNAVLEGLTAEPLRRIFAATIAQIRGDRLVGDDKRILKNILKRVIDLTETRNDIIHRTWYVGWASSEQNDFSSVSGMKFKNTTQGVEFRGLNYTLSDFDTHSSQADELTKIIQRLDGCIMLDLPFSSNFILDPDGTVRLPKDA